MIGWIEIGLKKLKWRLNPVIRHTEKFPYTIPKLSTPPKNYRFIQRDWDRSESDDWQINVQPKLNNSLKSLEIRDENGELFGWRIQGRGE